LNKRTEQQGKPKWETDKVMPNKTDEVKDRADEMKNKDKTTWDTKR